jgi:hypothetical protein
LDSGIFDLAADLRVYLASKCHKKLKAAQCLLSGLGKINGAQLLGTSEIKKLSDNLWRNSTKNNETPRDPHVLYCCTSEDTRHPSATITPSHLPTHPHRGLLRHPNIPRHLPQPNLLLFAIHPHSKWQTHEAVISRITPFLNILSQTPIKSLA